MHLRRTERRHSGACKRGKQKRGVVAVQVAVMATVLLGFAALAFDVGAMYNTKGELQRAADAAALAAASMLAEYGGEQSPMDLARAQANEFVGRNPILGQTLTLAYDDVEFGRAEYHAAHSEYRFTPTASFPDAVRVRVRMTGDSPNGSMPLYFARIFGKQGTDVSAEAIAMMVPRDISVVADLSASHNDDSELRHYKETEINLFDVWAALPIPKGNNGVGNGIDPPPPGNPNNPNDPPGTGPGHPGNQGGNPDPGANPQGGQFGPTWGWMYYWGNELTTDYEPAADPALMYFPKSQNWNNADLVTWYQNVGYSAEEIDALLSAGYDESGAWEERVAVAIGLARWDSGIEGGLWELIPPGQRNNGNGNYWVGGNELTWLVDYPYESGSWVDYISYTHQTWTKMYQADNGFRYRFGLKTYVNYLLERQPSNHQTSDLHATPAQPMQAVKEAVAHLVDTLETLETNDQVSLEIYGTTAHHEIDLTDNYELIADCLHNRQAGHYDIWTNMGGGIQRAIEELTGSRARPTARKVMFLLTDGKANVTEDGTTGDYVNGPIYATNMAYSAVDQGIMIFAVSVGVDADTELMEQLASIGGGEHFHAEGSIDQYSEQLEDIFNRLGGARPVELIK